jgi:hypothetical protein
MSRALARYCSLARHLAVRWSCLPRAARSDPPWRLLALALLPLLALGALLAAPPGRAQARLTAAPDWLAQAPRAYEIEALPDSTQGLDQYRVKVRPGSTLWDIATEALPRLVVDEGHGRALEVLEASFKKTFPDRAPNDVRLEDTFTLEVPDGTFVTASLNTIERGRVIEYVAFNGDKLTEYLADPALVYRFVRAADPQREQVLVRPGTNVPAVEIAKRVYQTNAPDFLQVRHIRGGLGDKPVVEVDLRRPYLDQFRNFRDRAVSVEPAEDGLQRYVFDPEDEEIPFVAVEDAIGDEWDPGNFPRLARNEFYRDGTVKRYLLSQPGEVLSALARPDNRRWATLLPSWSVWTEGQPERLNPFAPAVNELGSLIPGRLLVLVHQPKPIDAMGRGVECFGVPLGLAATAGLAHEWWRRRRQLLTSLLPRSDHPGS